MLLILAPLVLLAAGLAWAAGLRRGAVVGGGAVIVLLLLGSVLAGVLDPVAEERDVVDDAADDLIVPAPELEPTEIEPRVREPDVVLTLPADPFEAPVVLEGLEDRDVRMVEVAVEGRVTLHQCAAGAVTADRCAAGVIADGVDRSPSALVEVRARISTPAGPVDCAASACVLAAFDGPEPILDVPLVFGGAARPQPRVTIRPATGVQAGQDVTVTVDGLPSGAEGLVAFCTADEDATRARCREDAAVELSPTADRGGEASAILRLEGCPRTDRCAVRVAVDGAPPAYAELAFASPPGPDLGGGQLAGGLAAAGALFVAAVVLVRRTDWTNPDGDPFAGIDVGHDDPFAGIDLDVDEQGEPWS